MLSKKPATSSFTRSPSLERLSEAADQLARKTQNALQTGEHPSLNPLTYLQRDNRIKTTRRLLELADARTKDPATLPEITEEIPATNQQLANQIRQMTSQWHG